MMVESRGLSIEPYLSYWHRRRATERIQREGLAQQARGDAARIAAMLRQEFGVTRILLFGSLVKARFSPDSDIDLAVTGLSPEAFFSALAQANKLSDFSVDLKPLEMLEPHFKTCVLESGEEL